MSYPTRDEFAQWLKEHAPWLRSFTPDEVLAKCERHLNHIPPRELWPHILPTLRIVQQLRDAIKRPIRVNSVYRSAAYNATLPGSATHSQHTAFRAMDITVPGMSPRAVHALLTAKRDKGDFKGGLGLYKTFVHIDTRGSNADWRGKGVS